MGSVKIYDKFHEAIQTFVSYSLTVILVTYDYLYIKSAKQVTKVMYKSDFDRHIACKKGIAGLASPYLFGCAQNDARWL